MGTNRPILYLDTCAIIEAWRVGCWRALVSRFELHTVKECHDELGRGNPDDPDYVHVDTRKIEADIVVHVPTRANIVAAIFKSAAVNDIDKGERELLAWCAAQHTSAMILTTGDRAAIVAACELGLKDRLSSLEELANAAGVHPQLQNHYRQSWLTDIRTKWLLEKL